MQIQKTGMRTLLFVVLTMLCFALCAMQFSVFAATKLMDVNSDGTNDLQFDDKNNTITISEITAKLQAKQEWSFGGGTTKNDITITNICGSKATISFDYSVENNGTYGITGGGKDTGSSYTITLDSGEDFTVNLSATAGMMSDATTTFTMTNIKISIAQAVTVTVQHTENGSVNAKYTDSETGMAVNGTVSNGTAAKIDTNGITLTANPNAGKQFVAWVNPNSNTVLSQSVEYEFTPDSAITVKAVFADEEPWFIVDDTTLIQGWSDAFASGSKIVLANNATLPAGNYEVASEQILVVPFDAAGICYTTTPETLAPGSFEAPKAYRTLTMEDGASITVNGTMSVPAKVIAGNTEANRSACRVSGGYGHVKMESGSSITINNGGILSVFGYITGDGEVTANEGANVYESFQIADFRGGTATSSMNFSKKVFPFSQYYIQNIEAKLILYSGAKETAYTALYMSDTILPTSVTFISNSNAMFNLTSGSMVKKYDKATDRLIIDINGEMNISSISIEIKYIMAVTVESSKFPLPITNNMTVNIHSDTTTIGQDLALLPGSEIYIAEGATLKAASGCDVFLYDLDEWNAGNYVYSNVKMRPLYWSPDREKTRTAADLKDAQITVAGTLDGAFYTTSSGAAIKGVEGGKVLVTEGSADLTYQATQSGTDITYPEISVTAPKLQNAKNTAGATETNYTQTTAGTYVYSADHGRWAKDAHKVEDVKTNPTCTEEGYTTHTCNCGCKYEDTYVAALGHKAPDDAAPGDFTDATCTTGRVYNYGCELCGEPGFEVSGIDPDAHAFYLQGADRGTCCAPGIGHYKCNYCNATKDENDQPLDPNNHANSTPIDSLNGYAINATWCSACGHVHTLYSDSATNQVDEKLGYSFNLIVSDTITFQLSGLKNMVGNEFQAIKLGKGGVVHRVVTGTVTGEPENGTILIPKITMLELTDIVLVSIKNGKGDDAKWTEVKPISVQMYADTIFEQHRNNSDDVGVKETAGFCYDLLNFGKALQNYAGKDYTGYLYSETVDMTVDLPQLPTDLSDLMQPELTEYKKITNVISGGVTDVSFYAAFVRIGVNVYPGVYMTGNMADRQIVATINDFDYVLEPAGTKTVGGEERYLYVLSGKSITPATMLSDITFKIVDASDATYQSIGQTLTYSLESYAASKYNSTNLKMADLAKTMMQFANSAEDYLEYLHTRQNAA